MHRKGDGIKAIIVAPTRELTIQLYKEFLIFSDLIGNSKTLKK
jgi:superfamily II DNA/RNA helicase